MYKSGKISLFRCVRTTLNALVNPTLTVTLWSNRRDSSIDRKATIANGDTEVGHRAGSGQSHLHANVQHKKMKSMQPDAHQDKVGLFGSQQLRATLCSFA